jgi:hypothetical protein
MFLVECDTMPDDTTVESHECHYIQTAAREV